MEVLGAIGSSIAIAQALAAGPKVVKLIREIPQIQDSVDDLRSELDLISSIVNEAKRLPQPPPSVDGSSESSRETSISKAAGRVNEVLEELNKVLRSCVQEPDDWNKNQYKARKKRWFFYRGKIEDLRIKAHHAATHLHSAIICHWSAVTSESRAREAEVQAEMRQYFLDFMRMTSESRAREAEDQAEMRQFLMDFTRTTSEPSKAPTRESCEDAALLANPSLECNREQEQQLSLANLSAASKMRDVRDGAGPSSAQNVAQIWLGTVVYRPRESCSQGCRCRCHFNESSYASWNWVQPLLGSWIVRCNNIPYHRRPECTDSRCSSSDLTQMSLEYRVPKWLLSGLQCFRMSYTSLGGVACSLRPARVIQTTDRIWANIQAPSEIAHKTILEGPRFYPRDHDITGSLLIEYAVERLCFSAIEVLLNIWGSIILEQGFPRAVFYRVNQILLDANELGDHQVYLLNKVKSLVCDIPEWASTEVHRSIYEGKGLRETLREQPWAIDVLDDMGEAPLHTACKLDRVEDVERLIAAHADINQKGGRDWTPIFTAAHYSSLDCAKLLIKAGCAVQLTDGEGATTLHYAAWGSSHQLVSILLAAGASPTARDKLGNSPLHYLARHSIAEPKTLQTIVELLILTDPAGIEAANENGFTPVLLALAHNKLANLQALHDAGGCLSAVTYYNRNLLHLAAMRCTLDTLNFLFTLETSGVDTELQDSLDADTPWDAFRYVMQVPEPGLGVFRRPSPEEQQAFARLYQDIRNRNLQHDIGHLDQALDALRRQCAAVARQHIAVLMKQKEEWKKVELVDWYRAVDKRIQHSEWNLAIEDVQEYVEELKAELDRSVWDIPSKYNHMWDISEQCRTA